MDERLRRRIAAGIAACAATAAALLVPGLGEAGSHDGDPSAHAARGATASASAYAREEGGSRTGYVTAGRGETRTGSGTRASASVNGNSASAEASASVASVSIFDGLVTADRVEVSATSSGSGTDASGRISGLAIDGRRVGSPAGTATYDLDGHGTLTVLTEKRDGIVGLDARLSEDYRGSLAGTRVLVGFARASARDGTGAEPRRPAERRRPRAERRERAREPRRSRRPVSAEEREARRRAAPRLDVLPTGGGYAFPVYGDDYTFSDDWGAPRQHTGSHEGNDIFAPQGTPVVAVTDGRLFRVGTRKIPGNRLWLRNARGDTFFYAHLSAFAEEARNGADVRAGQVLGFVGSTGDAEQTPPHLHFEIHPQDGEAVNPYPFLRAWEDRRDVPAAAWLTRYGTDPGSRPGALVVVEDFLER